MAKRTSKKVRKVRKNAKTVQPTSVEDTSVENESVDPAAREDTTPQNVEQPSSGTTYQPPKLTKQQSQTVEAAHVGLTPAEFVYQDPEPIPAEDMIDMYLTPQQKAQIKEDAQFERFGRPVRNGREAMVSRLDSKLKEI